jgi:excisionase family DNA binding protein
MTPNTGSAQQTPQAPTAPWGREPYDLLKPGEVARLFQVSTDTVKRWARTGMLGAIRTPGGGYRYRASEIYAAYEAINGPAGLPENR